jgi:hypothetical protein
MARIFLSSIGAALIAPLLWLPATAFAWGGTLTVKYNSIHCTDLIAGGTRQTVNDGAASCSINIKEIVTQCVNKGGNADPSNSHVFALNGTPISEAQAGSQFLITKNGSLLSDIFFTQEEIIAATGIQLDPATLCPNKNFSLKWAVSRFDMVATVNNVVNGWVPFFPTVSPETAFASCDPAISGLTYTNSNGSTTDTTKGILSECWLFRNQTTFVDQFFDGTDRGGIALLDTKLTPGAFYNGVCQQHGKQNGSLGNVGAFNQIGPSPSDPECTGANTVLDGSY